MLWVLLEEELSCCEAFCRQKQHIRDAFCEERAWWIKAICTEDTACWNTILGRGDIL